MKAGFKKELLFLTAGAGALFIALRFGPRIAGYLGGLSAAEPEATVGTSVLIYDGECPVCRRSADWIEGHADEGSFEMLACQSPETRQRFPGITEAECMKSVQLVLPDGRILSGADSLPEIVTRLPRYRVAARLFRIPGAMISTHCLYRWFSEHRGRIAAVLFPEEKRGREGRIRSP